MQGAWRGDFQGYRGVVMQDLGYELRRIRIPRTWVNRDKSLSSQLLERPPSRHFE